MPARTLIALALAATPLTASAEEKVPAVVEELGLTEVEVRREHGRDPEVFGRLPDGGRVEIDLDRDEAVEEIESRVREGFPAAAVAPLVPEAVRAHPSYPGDARFRTLEFDADGVIEIEAIRPDGSRVEAEFRADGELLDFETKR